MHVSWWGEPNTPSFKRVWKPLPAHLKTSLNEETKHPSLGRNLKGKA